ncbi:dihydrolipoyllysine-residue succinyltransferase, partial [Candidatus Puniceispirillum sp.]|uniref:dihydrolipoyllysine-residue succinyltransferase n=1 Tax=Candidatus Puniceispirillum sp. TaxID=2026719 RepID=UPI001EC6FF52|nr:dihydrolipoyllysine-residue succinyltransferase [Candidatus Puniceispirillum sp.]
MATDIIVPTLGESVSDATIARWIKKAGDAVAADEPVVELETDKVTLEVPSPVAGQLSELVVAEGDTVEVGALLARVEAGKGASAQAAKPETPAAKSEAPAPKAAPAPASKVDAHPLSPAVRRLVEENNLNPENITGTGVDGRLTKADVLAAMKAPAPATASQAPRSLATSQTPRQTPRDIDAAREERVPMSKLRRVIAGRLKEAQNNAAMLTTFNEVDMTELMALRASYRTEFENTHQVRLGFMGMFVQASVMALREFPAVNAEIEGNDIIYKNYYNIGVAVGTPQGLVVPVIKGAEEMNLAEVERTIGDFGMRARDGKIAPDDMAGGTFTISNGG